MKLKTTWKQCKFGCVRIAEDGYWWILSRQDKGWSSFGCCHVSQEELERREHIRVLPDRLEDNHGPYYQLEKNMSCGHWRS